MMTDHSLPREKRQHEVAMQLACWPAAYSSRKHIRQPSDAPVGRASCWIRATVGGRPLRWFSLSLSANDMSALEPVAMEGVYVACLRYINGYASAGRG